MSLHDDLQQPDLDDLLLEDTFFDPETPDHHQHHHQQAQWGPVEGESAPPAPADVAPDAAADDDDIHNNMQDSSNAVIAEENMNHDNGQHSTNNVQLVTQEYNHNNNNDEDVDDDQGSYTSLHGSEEEEEEVAMSPPQQQQQQPPSQESNTAASMPTPPVALSMNTTSIMGSSPNYTMPELTRTDGIRQWGSWTRVFVRPRDACLDLLDNCLDAALYLPTVRSDDEEPFHGKIVMARLPPNGISIINNSSKRIRDLHDILVVYGSTKGVGENQKQDAIGENGIGLKHGCATLSNTNIVLMRNDNEFSIGFIAKGLQTQDGICLPSCTFAIHDVEDKTPDQIESELRMHIQAMVDQNPKIATVLEQDFGRDDSTLPGTLQRGVQRVVQHLQLLWGDKWGDDDHVFCLLICDLIHTHQAGPDSGVQVHSRRRDHNSMDPATVFLQEIQAMLPRHYINIPPTGFKFLIQQGTGEFEQVQFSYWQRRLIELGKFTVNIHREQSVEDFHDLDWPKHGYPLSIYCGFDPLRLTDPEVGHNLSLHLYSRKSGRLIECDPDARGLLKLSNQGSDYGQGFTVIVDDIQGRLPLMPTKQGIAWSEEKYGETHKFNFLSWVSAVAKSYYDWHLERLGGKKANLTKAVKEWKEPVQNYIYSEEQKAKNQHVGVPDGKITKRLEVSDLHTYTPQWKKATRNGKFRITRAAYDNASLVKRGKDTIFEFSQDQLFQPEPFKPEPPKKRRRSASSPVVARGLDDDDHDIFDLDDVSVQHGGINGVSVSPLVNNSNRVSARKMTGAQMKASITARQDAMTSQLLNAWKSKLEQERQNSKKAKAVANHLQKQLQDTQAQLQIKHRQQEHLAHQLRMEKHQQRVQVDVLKGENENLRLQLQEKDLTIARLRAAPSGSDSGGMEQTPAHNVSNGDEGEEEEDGGMGIGSPAFLSYLRKHHPAAIGGSDTFTI